MTKMNYMELYEFMLAANQGLNSRRDLLRKTQKSLNTFASGKGASLVVPLMGSQIISVKCMLVGYRQ
ncbi:hypothetical protein [Ligilactobacillus murinus]|uniref:hypothetical protein n=1 Tax=Ligilactobacillus murinus TaxID=1622 RepID=UPI001094AF49|nr:hypothetical protein [Ligilactobacillus murinus]TGY53168.1 hypothetical protein E5341_03570 [Ligilactobacillus murinus]